MDYKRIYDNIMNSDSKIRLVTICDLNGKIMYSDHRQGVKNLLTPEESKKSRTSCKFVENKDATCTKNWTRKVCIGRI